MANNTSSFSVGKQAFFDAGINLQAAVDKTGALAAMAADYDVKLEPIQVIGGRDIPDRFAVVRQDNLDPLEVVGSKYCALQNRDAATVCDSMVAKGEAKYYAGDCIDGGRKIWIMMRRPTTFDVVPGDTIESYFNVVNSHDGQSSLTIYPTSVRTVSKGTLNMYAYSARSVVKVRHTKGIANTNDLVEAIHMAKAEFAKLEEAAAVLAAKKLTAAQLDAFFAEICPGTTVALPAQRSMATKEDIMAYFKHGTGNTLAGVGGTAWALLNGLVEWVDYAAPTRAKGKDPAAQRMKSQLFGNNKKLKQQAFELLLKL
jgi:phage/plasmid-like protein (TIGR03299 family)